MKISARNQIKGVIKAIHPGATTTHVEIDTGAGIITASITNDSAHEMKLAPGQHAYAVIKATDVMVGLD
jgi:molybdopterin-binding protein